MFRYIFPLCFSNSII